MGHQVRFDDFFFGLTLEERRQLAESSGYDYDYIRRRLAAYDWRRGRPSPEGFDRLVLACLKFIRIYGPARVPSREQLWRYFYGPRALRPEKRVRRPNLAGRLHQFAAQDNKDQS
jgi:hypothetical protein